MGGKQEEGEFPWRTFASGNPQSKAAVSVPPRRGEIHCPGIDGRVDCEKKAQRKSCELGFIHCLTEDCSPGDKLSDGSEDLL